VQYGDHLNAVGPRTVIDVVRELLDFDAPDFSVKDSVQLWRKPELIQNLANLGCEPRAQLGLILISVGRGVEVGLGLSRQDDREAHFWNLSSARASTTSHGTTASGF
jgi:hypothetical protein